MGPLIMGVLNYTPDSFFDGGKYNTLDLALKRVEQMIAEGADIIDIGGESTRPGAVKVPEPEEQRRVTEVIREIRKRFEVVLSIDTTKSAVARSALDEGVQIINDISGFGRDAGMRPLMVEFQASCVLGHIQGTPDTMQVNPVYFDVVAEVKEFLRRQIEMLLTASVELERISVDPGIGFGKTVSQNYELLANLDSLLSLGCPLTVGVSRKSFIAKTPGLENSDRLQPSLAMGLFSVIKGASIVRVHDVAETREQFRILTAVAEKSREIESVD